MVKRVSLELGGTGVNTASEATAVLGLHSSNNVQFSTVGIGVAAGTPALTVRTASSGSTAGTDADDLVVENSVDGGISILTPDGTIGKLAFGDATDSDAGSILYDHATNEMLFSTFGTPQILIDVNGKMGLGTMDGGGSGPDGLLHVFDGSAGNITAAGAANQLVLENDVDAGLSILTPDTRTARILFGSNVSGTAGRIEYSHVIGDLSFWVENSEKMTILTNGRVGIGTDTPSEELDIRSTDAGAAQAPTIRLHRDSSSPLDNDNIGSIKFAGEDDTSAIINYATILATAANVQAAISDGRLQFQTIQAGVNSTIMTLENDRVGIGVTEPDGTLHVHTASASAVASTNANDLVVEHTGSGGISILADIAGISGLYFGDADDNDIGQIVYQHTNDEMRFIVNVLERMRITSVGKVGIGITGPDGTLHVHTATAGAVSAQTGEDDLVIENNGVVGLTLLNPDANEANIVFGSPSDNDYIRLQANYNGGVPFFRGLISSSEVFRFTSTKLEVMGDLKTDNFQNKNGIINGSFDIWQRGTSVSTGAARTYTSDRWKSGRSGDTTGTTVSRQTGISGNRYCARHQRDSGISTTNNMDIWTTLETNDSVQFDNTEVTFSFWMRKGANYSGGNVVSRIAFGAGTDQTSNGVPDAGWTNWTSDDESRAITTGWVRYSHIATVPSGTTQVGVLFRWTPTGTAGAADYIEVTGIQLEVGGIATEFERKPVRQILSDCQRYYRTYGGEIANELVALGQGISTVGARVPLEYTEMRIAPVFTISAVGDWGVMHAAGTIETITVFTASIITKRSLQMDITVAANMVAGNATILRGINTSARINLNAEL